MMGTGLGFHLDLLGVLHMASEKRLGRVEGWGGAVLDSIRGYSIYSHASTDFAFHGGNKMYYNVNGSRDVLVG